jgi:hypothetical protein
MLAQELKTRRHVIERRAKRWLRVCEPREQAAAEQGEHCERAPG